MKQLKINSLDLPIIKVCRMYEVETMNPNGTWPTNEFGKNVMILPEGSVILDSLRIYLYPKV